MLPHGGGTYGSSRRAGQRMALVDARLERKPMDCEYCARTIAKRKPFPIVSLGRRTGLGHHPTGPEHARRGYRQARNQGEIE